MAETNEQAAAGGRKPVVLEHLSVAERAEKGKLARAQVPRSSHAVYEPSPSRPDPIGLLEEQAACGSLIWCRSVTGACWCLRSRSTVGQP
jgi:hypothetical protein